MQTRVSIVIPTLNEANSLERTLRHLALLHPPAAEIIVVDGGSEDETVAIAEAVAVSGCMPPGTQLHLLETEQRGRSLQMNFGAEAATGDILCFLHADTWVPDDLVKVMSHTLEDAQIACGGFVCLLAGPQTTRWGISLHHYLKTYYAPLLFRPRLFFKGLRLLFGDQVMFCRRQDFWECGGFDPALPIMEDGDLCLKLVQKGRICMVNRVVQTSDRRVAHWGSLKATAIYSYIGFLWGLGVSATYLKKFYADIR
ncbi:MULTISPECIES: TIGR04283 family arsenosugar biosynthesis glycosyltransferase [Trichocoleus]|uniref:4,4'-diaponeurosporenoate glycosyltransferase n=1 Tax=Trichocoleus desertorum GB2-A4 TaxID=2933944 RepID=A0ABV0JCC0_9CYAN|nr:TIGR04283 family arsenosugar biosynthesis glycosyltransferase [Trichocoleus sp. FACHB-46]MBD1864070.1 TIGR04283 family arsenosugar biosynthesis glycosyltransferase [Trichocoleus sp. FACHB-46]